MSGESIRESIRIYDGDPRTLETRYHPSEVEVLHAPDEIEVTIAMLVYSKTGVNCRGNKLYFGKPAQVAYEIESLADDGTFLRLRKSQIDKEFAT